MKIDLTKKEAQEFCYYFLKCEDIAQKEGYDIGADFTGNARAAFEKIKKVVNKSPQYWVNILQ